MPGGRAPDAVLCSEYTIALRGANLTHPIHVCYTITFRCTFVFAVLHVVVHLQSGEIFRLEKNAVIERNVFMREPGETLHSVPFTKQLTINILLANGKGSNQSFYEYDHTKNNCQSFANDIIVKNGLSNPELEEKVKKTRPRSN